MSEARDRRSVGRLRPWFLVAAMLMVALMGLRGIAGGCATVAYLRGNAMPDEATALEDAARDPNRALWVLDDAARLRAIGDDHKVTLPLGVGEVLVSSLILIAAASVLLGRPNAGKFAGQVFAVATVAAIAAFVIAYPTQAKYVEALRRTAAIVTMPKWTSYVLPIAPYKGLIHLIGFQLLPLGLGAIALRTHRARAFFEQARESRAADEEDDA